MDASQNDSNGKAATIPQMKRWLRFSLRTMLLLITALCIWLGFQINAARRQKEAVAAILSVGGAVYYDYQYAPLAVGGPSYTLDQNRTPPGPQWLRQCIGDDYFRTVVNVIFDRPNNIAKGDLDQLAKLPRLRILVIRNCNVRD